VRLARKIEIVRIEEIRALKHAKPFRPFELVTKQGERIFITDPTRLALSPTGKSIMGSGQDGSFFLPISEVNSVRTLQTRNAKSKRKLPSSTRSLNFSAVNVKEIRELYSAAPFEPFELVLTNGKRLLVDHPEFMSFSRDYQTVHVHELDGSTKRIDMKMIVALNEMANGSRTRKRKQ
jgi:hypothetical protein